MRRVHAAQEKPIDIKIMVYYNMLYSYDVKRMESWNINLQEASL
ncbi:hypothetical protein FACS1894130_12070 [Spirochaetia bacterium]|nr:hypothetical protein FACS1894130_12070 [Spirochaetia bacterium]